MTFTKILKICKIITLLSTFLKKKKSTLKWSSVCIFKIKLPHPFFCWIDGQIDSPVHCALAYIFRGIGECIMYLNVTIGLPKSPIVQNSILVVVSTIFFLNVMALFDLKFCWNSKSLSCRKVGGAPQMSLGLPCLWALSGPWREGM